MLNFVEILIPAKVKSKLLVILGILITILVALPTYLSYRSTLQNTESQLQNELEHPFNKYISA